MNVGSIPPARATTNPTEKGATYRRKLMGSAFYSFFRRKGVIFSDNRTS